MAHADYACCGVCSVKMFYEGFSENHKTQLCEICLKDLREIGLHILTIDELKNWIKAQDISALPEKLKSIGYTECYYDNEIDKTVYKKLNLGKTGKPKNFSEFMERCFPDKKS